ncbi:subtilisin-like protein [Anaeromyces robustus]|uniref:Subtilisin-like protein n=1 Tax=Anaeromyces robustus TaxID=1754192 RepID=A0A1Y1WVU9_9FUNG|nr:subtilisin-like protein [Anaeromyces robustus]|eukprot:ORX77643.1 subtilisin-like protein [Anaeromyces robustus]
MNNYFLLFKVILLLNCFIGVHAENTNNSNYIVALLRNETDKNYYDENKETQNKIDKFINDKMNDIYDIINEHQNTYILNNGKQDDKLEELNFNPLKNHHSNKTKKLLFINERNKNSKRTINFSSNNSTIEYVPFESKLVRRVSPIANYYAISAYLSKEVAEKISHMENILYCEKSQKIKVSKKVPNNSNKNLNKNEKLNIKKNKRDNKNSTPLHYNINKIKNETNWSGVNVQQIDYEPNHLSLISQSPLVDMNQYDNNFYYPSSAGKGIDIYLIDEGLITSHNDFDTYKGTPDERTITCDALLYENEEHYPSDEKELDCTEIEEYPQHGIMVTSMAGGSLYGIAKKANLHMIAIDHSIESIIKAMNYVIKNGKPHKTIVNISFNLLYYSKSLEQKLTELINKGFIVIVTAGDDDSNCCVGKEDNNFIGFSGYRKAITVGAVSSTIYGDGYYKFENTNFGECVDIFGPGDVTFPYIIDDIMDETDYTEDVSSAAPIVAGVAATIMSEHPEIEYDNELMRKTLIEMSIKDVILDLESSSNTPNRFINNGKRSIVTKDDNDDDDDDDDDNNNNNNIECGIGSSTNATCSKGCCSKDGKCIQFEYYPLDECLIENGCQSEFGYCTTIDKTIEECENELKEKEKCLVDTSPKMGSIELFKNCSGFNIWYCKEYYMKLINNMSVCSLAKKYKSFGYIDNLNQENYSNAVEICKNNFVTVYNDCEEKKKYYEECLNLNYSIVNEYKKLKNDDKLFENDDKFIHICNNLKSKKCSSLYNEKENGLKENLHSCYTLNDVIDYLPQDETTQYSFNLDHYYEYYNAFIELCNTSNIEFEESTNITTLEEPNITSVLVDEANETINPSKNNKKCKNIKKIKTIKKTIKKTIASQKTIKESKKN